MDGPIGGTGRGDTGEARLMREAIGFEWLQSCPTLRRNIGEHAGGSHVFPAGIGETGA